MTPPKAGDPLFFIHDDVFYSGTFIDVDTKLLGTEIIEITPDENQGAIYPVYMVRPQNVVFLEANSRFGVAETPDEGSESGDLYDDGGV